MDYVCPNCKSDNIQRLSAVFEGGLSDINTRTNGSAVGLSRGGVGVGFGSAKTKGTSQTAASQRAAPPAKKKYFKPLLLIFVAVVVVSICVGSNHAILSGLVTLAWIGGSIAWVVHAFQYNSKVWPSLKATWDDSYLCARCNHIFCLGEH
jgi:hypothetical protein